MEYPVIPNKVCVLRWVVSTGDLLKEAGRWDPSSILHAEERNIKASRMARQAKSGRVFPFYSFSLLWHKRRQDNCLVWHPRSESFDINIGYRGIEKIPARLYN